jgi:hypothetical protein
MFDLYRKGIFVALQEAAISKWSMDMMKNNAIF